MKKLMLVCDCCKLPVPATKSADLCEEHFRVLQHIKAKNRISLAPKRKRTPRMWNKADYDMICSKVQELADTRPIFTGADVRKEARVKPAVAEVAIKRMIEAGKITSTGRSSGRRLSKAS